MIRRISSAAVGLLGLGFAGHDLWVYARAILGGGLWGRYALFLLLCELDVGLFVAGIWLWTASKRSGVRRWPASILAVFMGMIGAYGVLVFVYPMLNFSFRYIWTDYLQLSRSFAFGLLVAAAWLWLAPKRSVEFG
ncbi:hypothetical protein DJ021_14190 [Phenylobacterium hankyongense]|uniref:Uncharacterized protein n=1 Tax=Phenylobacterium hankyongense TaxID=1813876 RepID=A0A328B1V2_9CAUL|nr:hypothetical protein [Phenylobacterium hankyongense]RAK60879.1 hypothetical protein DJ021_14190 [Phenylobacterium hankyongense]